MVVVVAPEADHTRALRAAGAEVARRATASRHALAELGRRGITSLFLEGGRTLAAAFADAGQIDEARVFVAPVLLAGGAKRDRGGRAGAATDTLIETRFKEW